MKKNEQEMRLHKQVHQGEAEIDAHFPIWKSNWWAALLAYTWPPATPDSFLTSGFGVLSFRYMF